MSGSKRLILLHVKKLNTYTILHPKPNVNKSKREIKMHLLNNHFGLRLSLLSFIMTRLMQLKS